MNNLVTPLALPTKTIADKYSFLDQFQVPVNVLLVVLWVIVSVVYAYTIGRKRGPILLLSTYAGLAAAGVVTQLNLAPVAAMQKNEFFALGVFTLAAVLAFVALVRTISRYVRLHSTRSGMMLLGAMETGALLASLGSVMPAGMQKQIVGFGGMLFTTGWMHALWLIVPLIVLLIGEYGHRNDAGHA